MKKTHIIGIVLAVLIVAAGIGGFVWTGKAVNEAEAMQRTLYGQYQSMCANAEQTTLTVTEDGVVMGTYDLGQLGVLEDTLANVRSCFTEIDRMEPEAFAALSVKEKLQWQARTPGSTAIVDLAKLDLYEPMNDLLTKVTRTPSQDAYVEFENGMFLVHQEQPGTELQVQTVQEALEQAMSGLSVGMNGASSVQFELTDCPCYTQPEKTVENTLFDFDAMLRAKLETMTVELDFHGNTVVLGQEELGGLLMVDRNGKVQVQEEALDALVEQWHTDYGENDVPYLFTAQIGGVKPMDFLKVDYELDRDSLTKTLQEQLVLLDDVSVEAPWLCWRKGEAFEIAGTYVEIDIPNQVMTYVKDGEVLVTTDVVTGASWGYPTPPGFYKVENKDTNCWLSGEDYNVHVDYWIGFIGYQIGIHDADWRTKFGGENYVKNGSHGCVNTPKEAVRAIFDDIELGVPVLVYGK